MNIVTVQNPVPVKPPLSSIECGQVIKLHRIHDDTRHLMRNFNGWVSLENPRNTWSADASWMEHEGYDVLQKGTVVEITLG